MSFPRIVRGLSLPGYLQLHANLCVVVCLLSFAGGQSARAQSDDETSLRGLAERFLAAYQKQDLDALMSLWTEKSPDSASARQTLEQEFAAGKVESRSLAIRRITVKDKTAIIRIALEVVTVNAERGNTGIRNRTLYCSKTAGIWRLSRYVSSEEDLAATLASATSDQARNALLASDKDLMNVGLVQALLAQAMRFKRNAAYAIALECYAFAGNVATQLGDTRDFAAALLGIGQTHGAMRNYPQALEYEKKSLIAAEQAGDKTGVALAYNSIGVVHHMQGDSDGALDYYNRSLSVSEQIDDQGSIAKAIHNIALVRMNRGELREPLALFQRSLKIHRQLGDKRLTAHTLATMGTLYTVQHDYARSFQVYAESLKLAEEEGNKQEILNALVSLARTELEIRDFSNALLHYQRCLEIAKALDAKLETAKALIGIGIVHDTYTNYAIALEYYLRSLQIFEELGDRQNISITLNQIGNVQFEKADYAQALAYYQKSLKLSQESDDKDGVVTELNNIGMVEESLGNHAQALKSRRESLKLAEERGDKVGSAGALLGIALAHHRKGEYSEAFELINRASTLATQSGNVTYILATQEATGKAQRALNHPEQARQAFADAIATVERLRAQLGSGEHQQPDFFARTISPYYEMVDLLISQGSSGDALAVAEQAKGRVLLDVLQSGKADLDKALSPAEREQERQSKANIASLNSEIQREKLEERPHEKRLTDLGLELQKARQDYEAFQTNLYAVHPDLRVHRGETQAFTLRESSALIPDTRTALLEFAVLEGNTHVFVLTKKGKGPDATPDVKVYTLNIKEKDLRDLVERFRDSLADRRVSIRDTATKLYDLLLRPATAELRGKTRLVIIPDRVLWHLPFQALQPSPGRFLIESHAISYAPSLTVLREMMKLKRKAKEVAATSPTLLAFGNPDVGQSTKDRVEAVLMDEQLRPLPEAEKQVRILGQLYGAAHSRIYIGADAREERFKKEAAASRILQLATHGMADDGSPMYSHLVLSRGQTDENEDGLLEAWEIMKLDLNADLVVLSACDTARGRVVSGEGVIGLAWAFFVAGCPTTVVTQWKVESSSTTELMVEFHRRLTANAVGGMRLNKAEALRAAALKLLRTRKYHHPFYWAPFVVVGDAN